MADHGADGSEPPHLRFEVRAKLGAGARGVVYRAFDRRRGANVALRTLRDVTGSNVGHLKREFQALADMAHPNLVALHELHTNGGDWFLSMELVEGVTLIDWVRPPSSDCVVEDEPPTAPGRGAAADDRSARPAPAPAASGRRWRPNVRQSLIDAQPRRDRLEEVLYQLVDTVHALHSAGRLHGNIKPSNVLVDPDGRVVVLDFGLVVDSRGQRTVASPALHPTGMSAYMSPEQALDQRLTPASDWYAIGAMLYEALTGRRLVDVLGEAKPGARPVPPPGAFLPRVSPLLNELCMQLLSPAAALRPDGEKTLAVLGREMSQASCELVRRLTAPSFVGRQGELAMLRLALEQTRAGTGVAVFVRGASGMGKTALLRQFLDESALARGSLVLEGRCYERESVPFSALDAVVDSLTTHLLQCAPSELASLLPSDILALARLFPVLLRVPAIFDTSCHTPLPPDPLELRSAALGALRELLARISRHRPVVAAIDDMQWGDADSADALVELLHHPDAPPWMLIVTHRIDDTGVAPLFFALRRGPDAVGGGPGAAAMCEITLGPLSEAEARQLLGNVPPVDRSWMGSVLRDSGGNPMLLCELAQVRRRSGSDAIGDRRDLGLEHVLRQRIDQLPADAATLVTVCAAATRPLRVDVALEAAQLPRGGELLTKLSRERLLRVRQVSGGRAEVEPYHEQIRAAALARLGAGERQRVYAALATALEGSRDHKNGTLVDHWLEAGDRARAARYATLAGAAAAQRLAFHLAAKLYGAALAHGEHSEDERLVLHAHRAQALACSGQLDESNNELLLAATSVSAGQRLDLRRLEVEQRTLSTNRSVR